MITFVGLQGCSPSGCIPYFKKIEVNVLPSKSSKSFIADCGDKIEIQWDIANEDNIGSLQLKFLSITLGTRTDNKNYVERTEDLAKETRKFDFIFKGPVTVQLIVKNDNTDEKPHTVMLDFITKGFYFNADLIYGDNLREYPQIGTYDQDNIFLDFNEFIAFNDYGPPYGIAGVIDFLKNNNRFSSNSIFRARTDIPAKEKGNKTFNYSSGYHYPFDDRINAIVFGGTFAKFGEDMVVHAKKGIVTVKQGTTEEIHPIFLAIALSDYGHSNPTVRFTQFGNLSQGLILHNYKKFLPATIQTSIGSGYAKITQQNLNQNKIIEGYLKGATVGMLINTYDQNWVAAPVMVAIKNAEWRIPYLRDVDNLNFECGEY